MTAVWMFWIFAAVDIKIGLKWMKWWNIYSQNPPLTSRFTSTVNTGFKHKLQKWIQFTHEIQFWASALDVLHSHEWL